MSDPSPENILDEQEVSTKGAQFFVYLSPEHETEKYVTQWKVVIEAKDNNWSGTITSENPHKTLQTPQLSGTFDVRIEAEGPHFEKKRLEVLSGCNADIGCNANCASMVLILATKNGHDAHYCTTWDAICNNTT